MFITTEGNRLALILDELHFFNIKNAGLQELMYCYKAQFHHYRDFCYF